MQSLIASLLWLCSTMDSQCPPSPFFTQSEQSLSVFVGGQSSSSRYQAGALLCARPLAAAPLNHFVCSKCLLVKPNAELDAGRKNVCKRDAASYKGLAHLGRAHVLSG